MRRKRERPLGSKDVNPSKRKEQNKAVGSTLEEVDDKNPEEVNKIPEEINGRTHEEVDKTQEDVNEVPKETQVPNDYEISINYVINGTILNRNKTHVDEIFEFAIASDVINEEDNVPKTLEECRHRNDWHKWKDAIQA